LTSQSVSKLAFAVCIFGAMTLVAQTVHTPAQGPPPNFPRAARPVTPSDIEEEAARERLKKANLQRQAQLKADTDKLLELSKELKEYVDKTNENVLSLDVIKKADQIEKLAHSVKQKMSDK
jgi:hypothetical protein